MTTLLNATAAKIFVEGNCPRRTIDFVLMNSLPLMVTHQ